MNAEMIRAVYAYNSWATRQVILAAAGLDDETWATCGAGTARTLRETLVHLVTAQRGWLGWWDGSLTAEEAYSLSLDPEAFPDGSSLMAAWDEVDAATVGYVNALSDDDLGRVFEMVMGDMSVGQPLWQLLLHVANHGTQHRSEAAALLTEADASPGGLDMLWFFLGPAMRAPDAANGE